MKLSNDSLSAETESQIQNQLYAYALRLLARREHSQRELRDKLRKKSPDVSAIAIDAILEKLIASKALSDERFASAYVRMRRERGYGLSRITAELQTRGVSESLIAQSLLQTEGSEHDRMIAVYKKRFGDAIPREYVERARRMRFLQYRGFKVEIIQQFLGKFNDEKC